MGLLYGRAGRLTAKNGGFGSGQYLWRDRKMIRNKAEERLAVRARPGRLSGVGVFHVANRFCMALLYERAGRFTAKRGGFRPEQVGTRLAEIAIKVRHDGSAPAADHHNL
jgi:hypothetical protein